MRTTNTIRSTNETRDRQHAFDLLQPSMVLTALTQTLKIFWKLAHVHHANLSRLSVVCVWNRNLEVAQCLSCKIATTAAGSRLRRMPSSRRSNGATRCIFTIRRSAEIIQPFASTVSYHNHRSGNSCKSIRIGHYLYLQTQTTLLLFTEEIPQNVRTHVLYCLGPAATLVRRSTIATPRHRFEVVCFCLIFESTDPVFLYPPCLAHSGSPCSWGSFLMILRPQPPVTLAMAAVVFVIKPVVLRRGSMRR